MEPKKPHKRRRASSVVRELRIIAILQIRLDGASGEDARRYIAKLEHSGEPPWNLAPGRKPLSARQVRYYVQEADRRIAASAKTKNEKSIWLHIARRQRIYARAVQVGDYRAALTALMDLARLEGLYPAQRVKTETHVKHSFDDLDELTPAELDAERRRLEIIVRVQ